jgi:hypothetical protein
VTTKEQAALRPEYVVAEYEKYKLQEKARSTMATSNWPTVLAHACEAYGVYMRTVPPDQRRKISSNLAMIFAEGSDQGKTVKRDLMAAGFEVAGEESQMVWRQYQISGRQDLTIWKEGMRERIHVEVKSCSPFTFAAVNKVEDLSGSSKDWLVKWWLQTALYMILQSVDRYWMLLKDKSSGRIKIIEFLMNDNIYDAAEAMLQKAERINKLVQIGEVPPTSAKVNDADYCLECEFIDVCLPEITMGTGARILTDEEAAELEAMLDRREVLTEPAKEYKVLDGDCKEAIKSVCAEGQKKVVIGKWIADLKERPVKEFTVKARTDTVVSIFRAEPAVPAK